MKTNFTRIAALLTFAALSPVVLAAETEAPAKKVTKTETMTTTETKTKVEPGKPEVGTIARMVKDGASFSILSRAIEAAGLEDVLGGAGPNTIFAPTDEAFTKLPKGTLDKLMLPENKEKLRQLLSYHVIPGEFLSSSLKEGELKTASGDKVKIEISAKKVKINDAKVVNQDLVASNGIIQVIDEVLIPKDFKIEKDK